jgi:ferredoxin-NADP reductase
LIKIYRPNSHQKFPNGGKLTPFIENMKVGEQLNVEGPLGKFNYRRGVIKLDGQEEFPVKKIVMMAGGSGITPMFNVISAIVEDK